MAVRTREELEQDYSEIEERRRIDDLRAVLSSQQGRRVIARIVYALAGSEDVVGFGATDSDRAFHDGGRRVGQALALEAWTVAPDHWRQARAERDEEKAARLMALATARSSDADE